jgi:hypothetical protein
VFRFLADGFRQGTSPALRLQFRPGAALASG